MVINDKNVPIELFSYVYFNNATNAIQLQWFGLELEMPIQDYDNKHL